MPNCRRIMRSYLRVRALHVFKEGQEEKGKGASVQMKRLMDPSCLFQSQTKTCLVHTNTTHTHAPWHALVDELALLLFQLLAHAQCLLHLSLQGLGGGLRLQNGIDMQEEQLVVSACALAARHFFTEDLASLPSANQTKAQTLTHTFFGLVHTS